MIRAWTRAPAIHGLVTVSLLVCAGCTGEGANETDDESDVEAAEEGTPVNSTPPPPLTDAEIEALVAAYVSERGRAQEQTLRSVAERARPYLVKVLTRPESFEPLPGKPAGIRDTPAEKALELLEPLAPPEIVPILAPRAGDPSYRLRASVGFHVASTGSPAGLPVLARLLVDPESHVRVRTRHGIRRALLADRLDAGMRAAVFEPLARDLELPAPVTDDVPIELLLDLDARRALPLVTSDAVVSPQFTRIAPALEALTVRKLPLSGDRLLVILDAFPTGPSDRGNSRIHGEVLKALALIRHPRAEALIRKTLDEKPDPAERRIEHFHRSRTGRQELAAEALCILHGLHRPMAFAFERDRKVGLDGLTQAQRDVCLVTSGDGQIGNGGLAGFYEYRGDTAAAMLEGLRRMGAAEHAAILADANRLVGPKGLAKDDAVREARIDDLGDADEDPLSQLETAWYGCLDSLGMRIHLYCLEHRADFAPGQ